MSNRSLISVNPLVPLLISSVRAGDSSYQYHQIQKEEGGYSVARRNAEFRVHNRQIIPENELPHEVKMLKSQNGGIVYLIGTAHLSNASNAQVREIITKVKPDRVMVELCEERRGLMYQSETTTQNISWDDIKKVIKEKGYGQAMMLLPLLFASSEASHQLHQMPGAEFRVANQECLKVPGCNMVLGDRRLSLTISRMFRLMSPWEKCKFILSMLWDSVSTVTSDEIENMKDDVTKMVQEMKDGYPGVAKIIIDERNVYLTAMLQATVRQKQKVTKEIHPSGTLPAVVVAVVGIGHQEGIQELFQKPVTREELEELKKIPDHSMGNWIFLSSLQLLKYAFIGWVGYRVVKKCCPKTCQSITLKMNPFSRFNEGNIPLKGVKIY